LSKQQNREAAKTAFAPLFTIITLTVIVFIAVFVSVVSITNLRSTSRTQIESIMRERASRLTVALSEKFDLWMSLISHSAIGAACYMENGVDKEGIQNVFRRILDAQQEPDVWLLYCTNNQVWNQEGGFAIYHDGGVPAATWNNTERVWFKAAKENPGKVAFSEPYYAARNGQLTISLSKNIYDEQGNDIGVVSGDVSIDFLEAMLNADAVAPEQATYMIDMEGRFITHSDPQAVLKQNYFTESGLERFKDRILGTPVFSELDNDVYIYASAIPEAKWILVSTIPASIIFADVNRLTVNLIVLNSLLVIIAAILAVILIRVLRLLKDERDEMAAMKDNIKTGVFLMNKDCVIQTNYSASLEKSLEGTGLAGKKFNDLLAASFTPKELASLKDYFDMVQSRSMAQNKLDSLNPLEEFTYKRTAANNTEEKTLRCGFTSLDRNGETFVLGTVEDVTAESKLKKRLSEEESKRQKEMRALFEVIHVPPSTLADFVEDATYNFEQVMTTLQDSAISSTDTVVRVYQLIHAVKSDAYILGLIGFGDKLHTLETELKHLSEGINEPALEDMLHLTVEIEQILQEKDKLVHTLDLLRAHAPDEQPRDQENNVLVETLKKACERVSSDLGKKVRFVTGKIEAEALKAAPRRQAREILVQLVRNEMFHGIESPAERLALGKNETGVIQLSVQGVAGAVRFTLQDDGVGLNFDRIRAKALEKGLIKEDDTDENLLLRTIFSAGFSTSDTAGAHAGRGIGLNLVQDQIQALHGSIKVRTERGKGTAFIISIPL
jgi:two-component system chemotaxis sensor kinase CheA